MPPSDAGRRRWCRWRCWWSLVAVLAAHGAAAGAASCPALANIPADIRGYTTVERPVSIRTVSQNLTIYWSEEPDRVVAELLALVIHDLLGYTGLSTVYMNATATLCNIKLKENELIVAPAIALTARPRCDIDDTTLTVLQEAVAPIHLRLYAMLNNETRADMSQCVLALAYLTHSYTNVTAMRHCHFLHHSKGLTSEVNVLVPLNGFENGSRFRNILDALAPGVEVKPRQIERRHLAELIRAANTSILFLDYDELWADTPVVHPLALPRRYDTRHRVFAVSKEIKTFAPPLYDALMSFSVTPQQLRQVLELKKLNGTIERAVCRWAGPNKSQLLSWTPKKRHDYFMVAILCKDDPYLRRYDNIGQKIGKHIWDITKLRGYGIGINKYVINCTVPGSARNKILEMRTYREWYRCVGVVMSAADGDQSAGYTARNLPVVLFESVAGVVEYTSAPAGNITQLALVIRKFMLDRSWTRAAMLSEQGMIPSTLSHHLQRISPEQGIVLRDVPVRSSTNLTSKLVELYKLNTRVFLINGDWRLSRDVIAAAADLGLTSERYAWLATAWHNTSVRDSMRVFTFSYCSNGETSFGDAILSLGLAFVDMIHSSPQIRDDLRGDNTDRLFKKSLEMINETGECQPSLQYSEGALRAPVAFVREHKGNASHMLGTWLLLDGILKSTNDTIDPYEDRTPPHDGTSSCFWNYGDPFTNQCRDNTVYGATAAGTLLLAVTVAAAWALKQRSDRRRLSKMLSEEARTRAHRNRIATALVNKLISRDALQLREEIGSGRFGRVRYALLRVTGRRPRAVAAKALRDDAAPAEEGEFLREAYVLADLEHEHIVKLIGVCTTGGPLLVLMEHALFGDLLQYLRSRRHLTESPDAADAAEVEHVSAGELTRLAREAAAALGYLAHRGLVHRDVRAANCLVDARRTLKLGDFGLARETGPGRINGEPEYASRRRGLFPVLWMAPESLLRGAFSSASDVWSFGVLVLEVMSLGERPYGEWPPQRVWHHVLGGGRPHLPEDATAQARALVMQCWRHRPAERPTAADLVAYFAEHPRVLAPALAPLYELGSLDSGFCESAPPD